MFSLTVKVDPKIERELKRLENELPDAFAAAVYAEAVEIMRQAVERAPRAQGGLKGSAYVTTPDRGRVELGFGAPYAPIVEERTDIHHSQGEAKFFQRAIDASTSGLLQRLGDRLKPVLSGRSAPNSSSAFPTTPPTAGRSRSRRTRARRSLRR